MTCTAGAQTDQESRSAGRQAAVTVDVTHDFRSDHDRLYHPGNQDRAASRVRPGDGQGGVRRPARRPAADRRVLLRRLRGRGPTHRAGAGRWTAGHDLAGGLLARGGHRGEAGRGDRRGCHREGAPARRRWRPPGGHRHRPRWQRPRAASGPDKVTTRAPGSASSRHRASAHSREGRAHQDLQRRKPAMKDTQKSAKSTAVDTKFEGLTVEERGAMKERVKELKTAARRGPRADKADGESDVLAKIAEMPETDRAMAERLHAVIKASAPALSSRLWYGMPAYAKNGKVVCFFQSAQKFNTRYATFGFSDEANLDEGAMWPIAFALTELTDDDEARIGALVKKAVS